MAHVLVVDDDVGLREVVVDVIEEAGYVVEQAGNGREALAKMRESFPCVVLLDLMMPVMDGWEVIAAMDADPELASVPVCVVTAQDRLVPPHSACLLHKPVSVSELVRTVERYCGSRT